MKRCRSTESTRDPTIFGSARATIRSAIAAVTILVTIFPASALARVVQNSSLPHPPGPYPNPITVENALSGTSNWKLTKASWPHEDVLSGYAGSTSVNRGDSVSLYITDNGPQPDAVTLDVYRMGYYQGLGGRLIESLHGIAVSQQPACSTQSGTNMVNCANWSPTYTLRTESNWVSGDYVIKVTDARGYQSYIPVTVRNDQYHSTYLAVNSVNTWQAYNFWGGHSIYKGWDPATNTFNTDRGYAVSFDRPYWNQGWSDFPRMEQPEVMWLEEQGFDLAYTTDTDAALHPATLRHHKAVIDLGHSEYWPDPLRNAFSHARAKGVSLAFLGGNDMYWRSRYETAASGPDRILVTYKDWWLDPDYVHHTGTVSVRWRDQPNNLPENAVLGAMWEGNVDGFKPFVTHNTNGWEYSGTGAAPGEVSPTDPVGGEFDEVIPNGKGPKGLTILAASPTIYPNSPAYAVRALQYTTTCSKSFNGLPSSMEAKLRSPTGDYQLDLILRRPSGEPLEIRYETATATQKVSTVLYDVNISKQAPGDGKWHHITVSPSKELRSLNGRIVSGILGMWVSGELDLSTVKLTLPAGHGTRTSDVGPRCPWTPDCPASAARSFCSTLGRAGFVDGSAVTSFDRRAGEYVRVRDIPPVADTTIYRAPSGAWVFDASSYNWGDGLISAYYNPGAEWSVIQRLTWNVLARMGR